MKKLLVSLAIFLLTLLVFGSSSALAFEARTHGPRIKAKDGTSTNWSGYAVETNLTSPQNNVVSDVKGSWVVPSLTCGSTNTYSSAWVGMDGYSNNTVEQTGTEHDCINGSSSYYAWYEMYPKPGFKVFLAVKAGDVINAEVSYSNGRFQLTLVNSTTGSSFTTAQKSNKAQRQSAEWIMEAPWSGGVLPLANFGTINFSGSNATLNNFSGSISAFPYDAITMVNGSGGTKATPSGLANGGANFSVSWVNSN